MFSRAHARWMILLSAALGALLTTACDQAEQRAVETTELSLQQDSPENAARSALLCMRHELAAVANGHDQAAADYRSALRSIASGIEIEKAIASTPQVAIMLGDDPIKGYIDNWCSALSYYIETVDESRFQRVTESQSTVILHVPASVKSTDPRIKFVCVQGPDSLWRVARIGFVASHPQTVPTTLPATP